MKRVPSSLRKGSYVVCRFNGKRNGDLIVGEVESVRSGGRIVLKNMLTGTPSIKRVDVLLRRNAVVSKRLAMQVVNNYKKHKSIPMARSEAISSIPKFVHPDPPPVVKGPVPVSAPDRVVDLVDRFNALTVDDQRRFSRHIWSEILKVFGVD